MPSTILIFWETLNFMTLYSLSALHLRVFFPPSPTGHSVFSLFQTLVFPRSLSLGLFLSYSSCFPRWTPTFTSFQLPSTCRQIPPFSSKSDLPCILSFYIADLAWEMMKTWPTSLKPCPAPSLDGRAWATPALTPTGQCVCVGGGGWGALGSAVFCRRWSTFGKAGPWAQLPDGIKTHGKKGKKEGEGTGEVPEPASGRRD